MRELRGGSVLVAGRDHVFSVRCGVVVVGRVDVVHRLSGGNVRGERRLGDLYAVRGWHVRTGEWISELRSVSGGLLLGGWSDAVHPVSGRLVLELERCGELHSVSDRNGDGEHGRLVVHGVWGRHVRGFDWRDQLSGVSCRHLLRWDGCWRVHAVRSRVFRREPRVGRVSGVSSGNDVGARRADLCLVGRGRRRCWKPERCRAS